MEEGRIIILLCKYQEDTVVLKFAGDLGFSELKTRLGSNWNISDCDSFNVSYSIPDHPSCFLRNQDEFDTMFFLVEILNLKYVNIEVSVDERDCTFSGNQPAKGSSASVVGKEASLNVYSESLRKRKESLNESSASIPHKEASLNVHEASINISIEPLGQDDVEYDSLQDDHATVNCQGFVEDGLQSQCSSSRPNVLLSSHWSSILSHVGQMFVGGIPEFRSTLCKYSVELGFKFTYIKNNKSKVCAECSEKYSQGCNWYVSAVVWKVNGCCYVKKFVNEHTCGVILSNGNVKRLSFTQIADLILDTVRGNQGLSGIEVVNLLLTNYGPTISYKKAWQAVQKAKSMIFGDSTASFKELRWYVEAARSNNPGSHIVLQVQGETNRFERLFVAFNACIHGFQFCRPMLFVDGTFVKGKFKGCILSATGKYGIQGLYPLAFAVVDSENHDNWLWFLIQIRKIIDRTTEITFVSDRNSGLLGALPVVFPNANHFFCIQHLKNNLRDKFRGGAFSNSFREHMIWLFRECAYASTERVFIEKLTELKQKGGTILESFLEGLPLQNWTNVYSKGCRYGEMSSNAAESFNAWIVEARELPITQMVDTIRIKLMNRFSTRRTETAGWNGALCPKMAKKINAYINEGRTWNVKKSSESNFEVLSTPSVSVDIGRGTCSCQKWQLNGFPCVHAALAIGRSEHSIDKIVELYFHVKVFRKSYEESIIPIPTIMKPDFNALDEDDILAPSTKRPPGRPKKTRFRSRGEKCQKDMLR